MDESEIRRHINELDAAVPKDNAELIIYGGHLEEQTCEFIANRDGYLRAGIELLRAAVAPLDQTSITWISLDYLIRNRRSLGVNRLIRQQDVEAALPPVKKRTWKNKGRRLGMLTVILLLAICTFIGIGEVLIWVSGK